MEYRGFKAVYNYIENRLDHVPDIGKCEFVSTGNQDFIGTDNITEERMTHARDFDVPLDCVWKIEADADQVVFLKFPVYKLEFPNDCHLNYIQVGCTIDTSR